MRMKDVLERHPLATLFDLYPMQDRIEAAKDAARKMRERDRMAQDNNARLGGK